jgi:hypothetical protein
VSPRDDLEGYGKSRPAPQPVFDPRTFQPVASRYTDYAIPVHKYNKNKKKVAVAVVAVAAGAVAVVVEVTAAAE